MPARLCLAMACIMHMTMMTEASALVSAVRLCLALSMAIVDIGYSLWSIAYMPMPQHHPMLWSMAMDGMDCAFLWAWQYHYHM